MRIGEGAFIHEGVFIDGHVTIGPRVALGRDVLIATYEHERGPSEARLGACSIGLLLSRRVRASPRAPSSFAA